MNLFYLRRALTDPLLKQFPQFPFLVLLALPLRDIRADTEFYPKIANPLDNPVMVLIPASGYAVAIFPDVNAAALVPLDAIDGQYLFVAAKIARPVLAALHDCPAYPPGPFPEGLPGMAIHKKYFIAGHVDHINNGVKAVEHGEQPAVRSGQALFNLGPLDNFLLQPSVCFGQAEGPLLNQPGEMLAILPHPRFILLALGNITNKGEDRSVFVFRDGKEMEQEPLMPEKDFLILPGMDRVMVDILDKTAHRGGIRLLKKAGEIRAQDLFFRLLKQIHGAGVYIDDLLLSGNPDHAFGHVIKNQLQMVLRMQEFLGDFPLTDPLKPENPRLPLPRCPFPRVGDEFLHMEEDILDRPFGNAGIGAVGKKIHFPFADNGGKDYHENILKMGHGANNAAQLVPADVGHDQVDKHDVRGKIVQDIKGGKAILGNAHRMPLLFQKAGKEFKDERVVVHHQNLFGHGALLPSDKRLRTAFPLRETKK